MVSFENFVKSMPPSLSELKVIPSFCFAFKIPEDVTANKEDFNWSREADHVTNYSPYYVMGKYLCNIICMYYITMYRDIVHGIKPFKMFFT